MKIPTTLSATALGFTRTASGWSKLVAGRELTFRRLRSRPDLEATERLQRSVFGVSERDLASFSILAIIHKTGGEVLGAFDDEQLAGFIWAYGGYVAGQPRLVSDMMAVDPAWRGGLGYTLKCLQAIVALEAGFPEVVWTVDPLRAANARLNFERLGAWCHAYERDVYGSDFAEGLYAGLPSDRLLVRWPLTSERVTERLLRGHTPLTLDAVSDVPDFTADTSTDIARLAIPSDIDSILATDPAAGRDWRFRLRAGLEGAFAHDYAITGYAGDRETPRGYYLLERGYSS